MCDRLFAPGGGCAPVLRCSCVCRQLHRDGAISFAGYKIPHPLEYQMLIKVRASSNWAEVAAVPYLTARLAAVGTNEWHQVADSRHERRINGPPQRGAGYP